MSHAISDELLKRFDVPGPRYTSYPTADRFVEAFTEGDYIQALEQRRAGSLALPLSIYVHIPFCESVCYYCACNKVITKHHERAAEYLRYLSREVELQVQHFGKGHSVSQLHLGGGTPTFLSDPELEDLMTMIRRNFTLVPGGEYSIEVDPRTVTDQRLQTLARLGFNRLSFGVQDFDPAVQKAVHRVQPADQVFALVETARKIGFESVNVDLIYGLPLQTPESFARTLGQVAQLRGQIPADARVLITYGGGSVVRSGLLAQIRSDVAFHRAIADATHNPVFSYLIASLLALLHDHVQVSLAGLSPQSPVSQQLRRQHDQAQRRDGE